MCRYNAARLVSTADGGLRAMCAETLLRTAGSDGMNSLDPFEFDVVLESLKGFRVDTNTGDAATTVTTGLTSAAADYEEDPYAFDVFLTLITGRDLHSSTF